MDYPLCISLAEKKDFWMNAQYYGFSVFEQDTSESWQKKCYKTPAEKKIDSDKVDYNPLTDRREIFEDWQL